LLSFYIPTFIPIVLLDINKNGTDAISSAQDIIIQHEDQDFLQPKGTFYSSCINILNTILGAGKFASDI
jgi:hypothetical protein